MGLCFKTTQSLITFPTFFLLPPLDFGPFWARAGVKTTCVIGTDPPVTSVPESCSKYGGKAQGQVLQGSQRMEMEIMVLLYLPRCCHPQGQLLAQCSLTGAPALSQLPAFPFQHKEAGLGITWGQVSSSVYLFKSHRSCN